MQLSSERIFGLFLAWPCSQVQKLSMIYLYSICGDTHTHRARGNERKAMSAWKKHTISKHKPVYAAFQSFIILTHFLIILYVLLIHCMIFFLLLCIKRLCILSVFGLRSDSSEKEHWFVSIFHYWYGTARLG